MASTYPGAIDSFSTINGATDNLNSPSHAGMHNSETSAIIAIETTVGTNPQGDYSDIAARLDALEAGGVKSYRKEFMLGGM